MKKPSNLFDGYVCYGIGGHCKDKGAQKDSRKTGNHMVV